MSAVISLGDYAAVVDHICSGMLLYEVEELKNNIDILVSGPSDIETLAYYKRNRRGFYCHALRFYASEKIFLMKLIR